MKKNLLYLMASAVVGMADATERRRLANNLFKDAGTEVGHIPDEPPPPRRTCKDCYFCPRGTFCKQVKHNVNKQTPANGCVYFKKH